METGYTPPSPSAFLTESIPVYPPHPRSSQVVSVWKTVEDDCDRQHPFMYAIRSRSKIIVIDTGAGGGDYRLGPYGLGVVDRFADPRRWSALCLFHGDL